MTISERQEIDRLQQRCARLQGELTCMTKRAKLYKAALKPLAWAQKAATECARLAQDWERIANTYREQRDQLQASYAHDRAMFTAREERNRQALQEGSQACLGDLCTCRTSDCQSRAVCGLSGRVTQ